jgi:hypothetical protein
MKYFGYILEKFFIIRNRIRDPEKNIADPGSRVVKKGGI